VPLAETTPMVPALTVGNGVGGVVPESVPAAKPPEAGGTALVVAADWIVPLAVEALRSGSRWFDASAANTAVGLVAFAAEAVATPLATTETGSPLPLTGVAPLSDAPADGTAGEDPLTAGEPVRLLDAMAAGRPTVADAGSIPSGSRGPAPSSGPASSWVAVAGMPLAISGDRRDSVAAPVVGNRPATLGAAAVAPAVAVTDVPPLAADVAVALVVAETAIQAAAAMAACAPEVGADDAVAGGFLPVRAPALPTGVRPRAAPEAAAVALPVVPASVDADSSARSMVGSAEAEDWPPPFLF
jgi:hypothetical protein